MNINDRAPVKATREILIEAAAAKVWALLLDIDGWPKWNPTVSRAHVEGPPAPGTVFRWKSGGSSILSTLEEVEAPVRVGWTGRALGTLAVHVWTLAPTEEGVIVRTAESLEGWLVRLVPGLFRRMLHRSLDETLRALKEACESPRPPAR